jgi:hypothetical protein
VVVDVGINGCPLAEGELDDAEEDAELGFQSVGLLFASDETRVIEEENQQ